MKIGIGIINHWKSDQEFCFIKISLTYWKGSTFAGYGRMLQLNICLLGIEIYSYLFFKKIIRKEEK